MKTINPAVNTAFEITSLQNCIGQTVTLKGTIHKIRKMSGFAFVVLRTNGCLLQCIHSEAFSEFALETLTENMAVTVHGSVVADARSKIGCELHLYACTVLSYPEGEPPIVINNKEVHATLETLLDYRPLTLRNPKERAIFKIQAELCRGFRNFLTKNHFTEIHTPKIVSGTAEGGANVFALSYFGKEAFLTQSPQFYKQIMVGVLERVYEIAPVFRAEKHDTSRHINEYTSIDLEMGFIENYEELMQLESAMLRSVFEHIQKTCPEELALLKVRIPVISEIPSIPFTEAKEWISRTYHRPIRDEEDFEPEEEKLLCELVKKETGSEFVFVTKYRSSKRPFYAMDCKENPIFTESFDLLFRGMEITTGGQRIHSYTEQVEKMRQRNMHVDAFSGYLMAHKYGLPPHGGMGIGLERLTAKLLGFENVRNATLFPRDTKRLYP